MECDSEECRWARDSRGTVAGKYNSYDANSTSTESGVEVPSMLLEPNASDWRWRLGNHHQPFLSSKDPFDFFANPRDTSQFIHEAHGTDPLMEPITQSDGNGLIATVVTEPKLDLSQVAAEVGLSPEDIDAIMMGKSP